MSLGGYIRSMPAGIVMLVLSVAIMALGAAVAQTLSGLLVIDFSGNSSNETQSGWVLVGATNTSASGIGNVSTVSDGEQYKIVNGDGNYVVFTYTNNATTVEIVNTSMENVTLSEDTWTTDNIIRVDSTNAIHVGRPGAYALAVKVNDTYWVRNGTVELYKYIPPSTNNNAIPSLDLGFLPGLSVVFAGLYLFLRGLRQLTRTRI